MPQSVIVYPVDAYVVETLKSVMGKQVVLETTHGGISGCVVEVKPDHLALDTRVEDFFARSFEAGNSSFLLQEILRFYRNLCVPF